MRAVACYVRRRRFAMAKYMHSFAELLPPLRQQQRIETEELEAQVGKTLPPNAALGGAACSLP
jgi:hypothetical protein